MYSDFIRLYFVKFYGFFSLLFIEVTELIKCTESVNTLIIFVLQIIVGFLTIIKLWSDIRAKRFKNLEKTEKSVEKKRPFLFNLLKILKK